MNTTPETRHTLDDLSALTELSLRTIRYYIQQGLMDRPIGEKRAAYYTAAFPSTVFEKSCRNRPAAYYHRHDHGGPARSRYGAISSLRTVWN